MIPEIFKTNANAVVQFVNGRENIFLKVLGILDVFFSK